MAPAGVALVVLVLLSVAATPLAGAQSSSGLSAPLFGLKPAMAGKTTLESGHYQYAVTAGSTLEDGVIVYNFSDSPLTLQLYPADVITPRGGGVTPVDPHQTMHEVGAWLKLEESQLTVPAKSSTFVAFALSVPATIAPGDHLGAVVASQEAQTAPGTIGVERRVALIVRVRVPGVPRLATSIGPLNVRKQGRSRIFTIKVRNTGNLLFTATGNIEITDHGRRVAELPLSPADVYVIPGGVATFHATWRDAPLFGARTAVASFDARTKGGLQQASSRPTAVRSARPGPWIAGGASALVVVLLLVIGSVVRSTRRQRIGSLPVSDGHRSGSLA